MTETIKERPAVYIPNNPAEIKYEQETVCYEFSFIMPYTSVKVAEMNDAEVLEAAVFAKTFEFLDEPGEDIYDAKGE